MRATNYYGLLICLMAVLMLHGATQAACLSNDGYFFVDKNPPIVSWRYKHSEKAPLFLMDADAASFTALRSSKTPECEAILFGKDKSRVYFEYQEIQGADPTTFMPLAGFYSRDSKHVYWKESELKGADAATFDVLGEDTAHDGKQIFFQAQSFPAKNHRKLQFGYQIVGDYVLYQTSKVDMADPITFEVIAAGRGRDAKAVFFEDRRMPHLDRTSFRVLGDAFYADKYAVRSNFDVANGSAEGIPGLDPTKTVAIEQSSFKNLLGPCHDKNGQVRCLTDGTNLIAIVRIGSLESQELKAAPLKSIRSDGEHLLQFGSEIFDHLQLIENSAVDLKNMLPVGAHR